MWLLKVDRNKMRQDRSQPKRPSINKTDKLVRSLPNEVKCIFSAFCPNLRKIETSFMSQNLKICACCYLLFFNNHLEHKGEKYS